MGNKKPMRNPKGSPQNLIPIRDTETAKRLGAMGGRANKDNPNQKLAAKLRALKRKGLTDENVAHLMQVMEEHDMSALDVRLFLDSLRKEAKASQSFRDKVNFGKALIEWHKMHHGTKQNIDLNLTGNVNFNFGFNMQNHKFIDTEKKD